MWLRARAPTRRWAQESQFKFPRRLGAQRMEECHRDADENTGFRAPPPHYCHVDMFPTYPGRGSVVGTGLAESELTPLLEVAREKTTARGQRLIWYTPTQYCDFDPMSLDLGVKGCTAALYNMCVEPDGGVLPCQSYYHQLGNLLVDEWDSIWNHDLAIRLRERQSLPEKCTDCAVLAECGGGCPLQFEKLVSRERLA